MILVIKFTDSDPFSTIISDVTRNFEIFLTASVVELFDQSYPSLLKESQNMLLTFERLIKDASSSFEEEIKNTSKTCNAEFIKSNKKLLLKTLLDLQCCVNSAMHSMGKGGRRKLQSIILDVSQSILTDVARGYMYCFASPQAPRSCSATADCKISVSCFIDNHSL